MNIPDRADMFQAHTFLFSLSLALREGREKEVGIKCREMAEYLRGILYDPAFRLPHFISLPKDRDGAIEDVT